METVRVDVAGDPGDIVTLVGLIDGVGPVGETLGARLIVPLNPFSLVMVMADVPDEPCLIASEDGFDVIAKPGDSTLKVPVIVGWTVQ